MNWKAGASLLLILQFFQASQGLRCFVCNSAYQKNCATNPKEEYIVECSPETALPLVVTQQHGKLTLPVNSKRNSNANANPNLSTKANEVPTSTGAGASANAGGSKNKRMENMLALESEAQLAASGPGGLSSVNYTFCRKTITRIPRQENKDNIKEADRRIVRSCGWVDDGRVDTCKWSDSGEIQNEYCVCNGKDECNHGTRVQIGIIGASVVSVGLMIVIANVL